MEIEYGASEALALSLGEGGENGSSCKTYVLLSHDGKIRTRREVLQAQKPLRPVYILYLLQLHKDSEGHDNVGTSGIPMSLKPLCTGLRYGWRKIGVFISVLKRSRGSSDLYLGIMRRIIWKKMQVEPSSMSLKPKAQSGSSFIWTMFTSSVSEIDVTKECRKLLLTVSW